MTEGVTTAAAMPGAVQRPPEGRDGRRDEHTAGAFDEVLGAPKTPHHAGTGASAKPKTDAWRQAGTRLGAGGAALDTSIAKDGHTARSMIDAMPVRGLAGSLDRPGDGSADNTDPAEAGADDGLPTQMRAEQAISAIMTIAPIARQSALSIGHHGARKGGEAAAGADGETTPPSGSKAGLAAAKLGLEQPSQTREQISGGHAAAKGSTQSPAVGTDATVPSVSASGHRAKAPGNARADGAKQADPQARLGEPADAATAKSTAAVPGQVRPDGSSDGSDARQGGSEGRNAAREFRRGEQISTAGKVSVIAGQAVPAPVAPPLSANSAAIVNAVGTEPGWRAAANLSSALPGEGQNSAQPMRELKIQLHPLELGVVTAHLRTVGEKLSVELKVDNHDAYRPARAPTATPSSNRCARSAIDIDSVSIQQPQAATTAVARAEPAPQPARFSRDASVLPARQFGQRRASVSAARTMGKESAAMDKATNRLSRNRSGSRWRQPLYLVGQFSRRVRRRTLASQRSCAPPSATTSRSASSMRSA